MPEQQIQPEDRGVIYTIPSMEQAKVQKDLIYKTVEGMDLKLDLYFPAHHDGHTPLPAVILVHGDAPPERLRNAKDWGQYVGWGQLIAACGFIAIPFNHRALERLTKTEEVMSDVEDAISYVQRKSQALHIDADRLCVWTYSGGGPFGLRAALSLRSSFVRCLVCYYSSEQLYRALNTRIWDLEAQGMRSYQLRAESKKLKAEAETELEPLWQQVPERFFMLCQEKRENADIAVLRNTSSSLASIPE